MSDDFKCVCFWHAQCDCASFCGKWRWADYKGHCVAEMQTEMLCEYERDGTDTNMTTAMRRYPDMVEWVIFFVWRWAVHWEWGTELHSCWLRALDYCSHGKGDQGDLTYLLFFNMCVRFWMHARKREKLLILSKCFWEVPSLCVTLVLLFRNSGSVEKTLKGLFTLSHQQIYDI